MHGPGKRVVLILVIVSALAGSVLVVPELAGRLAYAVESAKATVAGERLRNTTDLSTAFSDVAEMIRPSVVSISSVKKVNVNQRFERMPNEMFNSPFRDFFGDDFFDRFFHPQTPQQGFVQKGLGTGVIVSEDGYVLTNNHVVNEADEVTVRLSDDRDFTAKVVGTDPKTDLAVVKIDAKNLHAAKLGDSDALKIGEWVVAAGNPFGLSHTITTGIVSAKGRANVGVADYEDFIQTDAAINPGNSGGPLVNLHGEVIGINTAIFSRSGGYMGIGFAIPINMAKSVLDSLIKSGQVVRGWLGVAIQDLNKGLAESFGYSKTEGVLVGDVTKGGPGEKAGLKQGDIIVRFDGKDVADSHRLRSAVAASKPGAKVPVEVFRSGKRQTITVEIGELETAMASARGTESSVDLGMTVKNLTPEVARELGYEQTEGVLVTAVEPLGMAAKAGIVVKDLIISVQGEPVKNVTEFRREVAKHDLQKGMRLLIQSGGMQRFVFLRSSK
jgi:serine protease Do